MNKDESEKKLHGKVAATEAKRTAARRRFLKQGTAGTGILIVTLHHQRAIAAKKIMTSGAATCLSAGGTVGKTTTVTDKSTGLKTTATQCTIP